jgi:hypothetical protein
MANGAGGSGRGGGGGGGSSGGISASADAKFLAKWAESTVEQRDKMDYDRFIAANKRTVLRDRGKIIDAQYAGTSDVTGKPFPAGTRVSFYDSAREGYVPIAQRLARPRVQRYSRLIAPVSELG